MSRSKTFSGRDDDNLCLLWPAAFWSQARKTGTSVVMAASLAPRSSVTGAVRRYAVLLESVDGLVCHSLITSTL